MNVSRFPKHRQFPAQTGEYAVKVKNGAVWQDSHDCRLQISVGMPYHEGSKFEATLNWAKDRYNHVEICVNDTLQRFNYMFDPGMNEEEAWAKTLADGDNWLKRNMPYIHGLADYAVYRWEDWRGRDEFPAAKNAVEQLYKGNREFKLAIDENISEFWARKVARNETSRRHFSAFFRHSLAYLLEETAVFSMMFNAHEAVDVYPGTTLLPCVIFQGRHVENAPAGLGKGHFARIDFKRNHHKVAA